MSSRSAVSGLILISFVKSSEARTMLPGPDSTE